jgi:hypothetical protein
MPKKNTRSHNWVLTLSGATLWGHCPWDTVLKRYVDDKKLRFIAYHSNTCPETGAPCYRVYCVFTNQVRFNTVVRLFPASACVPVHGKLGHDPAYCSNEASFIKLGVGPAQGRRKNSGDAVGVQCKKRKISENEAAQGLERKPAAAEDLQREYALSNEEVAHGLENLPKNLGREHDPSSKEKDKMLDDLKKQLETSKKETKDAQRISDDRKTQLDVAEPETAEDLKRKHDLSNQEKERIFNDLTQQLETSRKETLRVTNDLSSELDVAARVFISHIKNNFNQVPKDLRGTLEEVYRLQPPLCERHKLLPVTRRNSYALPGEFRGRESLESLMKAFKLARMHYHPDKNVNGGAWHQVVCLHISKLFTNLHDYIYGGDHSQPMA